MQLWLLCLRPTATQEVHSQKALVAISLMACTCSPFLLLSNKQRPWHIVSYHRPTAAQDAHNQEAFATGQLLHWHVQQHLWWSSIISSSCHLLDSCSRFSRAIQCSILPQQHLQGPQKDVEVLPGQHEHRGISECCHCGCSGLPSQQCQLPKVHGGAQSHHLLQRQIIVRCLAARMLLKSNCWVIVSPAHHTLSTWRHRFPRVRSATFVQCQRQSCG